jgi:hypothetical protein
VWIGASTLLFAIALVTATGAAGLLYALVYAAAILPGAWMGQRLIGPGHPAGWIAGALVGYGATQIALWLPMAGGWPSASAFLGTWLAASAVLAGAARATRRPAVELGRPSPADWRALAATLVLVPVLMGPPYRNIGAEDQDGSRLYRAYFTADFVWHTALASELGRYEMPPRNPYLAAEPIHYYWTYFLLPAVVAEESPAPLGDVQRALKANAMLSALLLAGMLFWFVRAAVPLAWAAAAAVALAFVATSAEGAFVLQQLWRAGRPIAAVTDLNIDAITAWQFNGLRVDGLARGLWYNPQHSLACALGLGAAWIAAVAGARASTRAIVFAGVGLAFAVTMNPFVGGVFSLIYAAGIALDARRTGAAAVRAIARHAWAAVPVVLALGWSVMNDVAEGAAGAVRLGFQGDAANNTLTSLLLSTGPILLPSLFGLWPFRGMPARSAFLAGAGSLLALALMHLLTLTDASWVGFRTGQILLLLLPVLLARALAAAAARHRGWAAALAGVVLVAGAPTTVIDTYNAQDVGNRQMGPGFRWTIAVTPAQQAAFSWIQANLPDGAIVQMEPTIRGREHWSLIPSFAERRMSAGLPISLLPAPAYAEGAAQVQRLFETSDPREARDLARARAIQYIYVDDADRRAYPAGARKFESDLFQRSFSSGDVAIYRVR